MMPTTDDQTPKDTIETVRSAVPTESRWDFRDASRFSEQSRKDANVSPNSSESFSIDPFDGRPKCMALDNRCSQRAVFVADDAVCGSKMCLCEMHAKMFPNKKRLITLDDYVSEASEASDEQVNLTKNELT